MSRKLVLACCLFLGTAGAALAQTASSTGNSANPAPTGNAMSTDTMQPTHPDTMAPGHTQTAMSHDNMSHDTMSHDNMSPGTSHPSMAPTGTTQQ